jgi:squalene-hopene/tetraprenyl-beta-curcumene cyclase
MLVICGVMDERSCRNIPQLPFELVLLPSSWYSFLNLRVVSYALPALIAMGIFIFKKRKRHNPLMAFIRRKAVAPSLKKLSRIVPESGGFLEASPLTGFVAMCLVSSGMNNHPVVTKGIEFLLNQQRSDGSWAIDTDLSTWVTTLSLKALGSDIPKFIPEDQTQRLKRHLLNLQYKERHAFNEALPGGWGWTNYSGSVPDVDDTCGAILALLEMYQNSPEENLAIVNGCKWLLAQQNNDGGFPTFCRGWGKLPFDSSCSDLTGHAFCALMSAVEKMGGNISENLKKDFIQNALKGLEYLKKEQRQDGSWIPLWFGNQLLPDKSNPVYGTSKVAVYLFDCLAYQIINEETRDRLNSLLGNALNFLLYQQNNDGSWGGALGIKGSIEETSLAISALSGKYELQCIKGFQWLSEKFESQGIPSTPIGLYFAALWYDEQLYPLIYYIEALRRFHQEKGLR